MRYGTANGCFTYTFQSIMFTMRTTCSKVTAPLHFAHTAYICFVGFSEQKAMISVTTEP